MNDYMVRGTAANEQLRVFAATTRTTVETARAAHNTSPVMTAALGRLLTAGAMMGSMMKGEKDLLTLQVRGEGPGKGLTVTADSKGNVKGYALVPQVILPANEKGKLDVGGAMMGREFYGTVGEKEAKEGAEMSGGVLSVIKDLGMKEPYVGQTALQTGEIAEDLTYYFAVSEQTPSSVGLGVLMEKSNTVKQAGGFIIQLMPYAEDAVIEKLEQNLQRIKSVTTMLEEGLTPEGIVETVLDGMDIRWTDRMPVRFACHCDKARVEKALISIGRKELADIIADGKPIEVKCHFCNKAYCFTVADLAGLLEKAK